MSAASAPPASGASPFGSGHDDLISTPSEAIVTVDEKQRIVMMNVAAQRMFGCTAADALGSDVSRFIPMQHREAHAVHVRDFSASGRAEMSMGERGTVLGLRANGQQFPAVASISRMDVVDELGTRRYFTALINDLSQERSTKAQVEALRRRMRTVFELIPAAIWITEEDTIVFANRACAELFGAADRPALIGRSIYSLLTPDSHRTVRQKVEQALRSDIPVPILSERIARLDGVVREVVIAVAGLPDHGRTAVQMVISDVTERTRQSQEMERSRHELRRLSASLVDAREEERRRIARELHDELGQRLTALKLDLSSLALQAQASAFKPRIASMLEMVDETVASVRRIATDLRPLMLDDLGLNAAIEWLADGWARRMNIAVKLTLGKTDPPVSNAAAIALYRMVQEALTNIARYAHATEVHIEIRQLPHELVLSVQDNGVGFKDPSMYPEGSHGLMGLRERAYMLGGQLEVGNAASGGGRIAVRLPVMPAGAEPASADAGPEDAPAGKCPGRCACAARQEI
jgi:two-component system sensor histidine kinase UhpB